MRKFIKLPVLALALVLILCATLSADFTVKTKMTMTMPMMGNMDTEAHYLIKSDKYAAVNKANNPMAAQMGQPAGSETKMIMRKGGKELVFINYAEKTYYIMDEKMLDSMGNVVKTLGGMLDSLKQMMSINKFEAKMTGNKKKVGELKAEEFMLNMEMVMKVAMMGPEPTAIPMKISGTQWGTKDFPENAAYAAMVNDVAAAIMGGSGAGVSNLTPYLEALGMDKATIEQAMAFSSYIPVEGSIAITMEIPGMPMNMQVTTSLLESSNAAIPDAEFEVPAGFEKVAPDLDLSEGGLGLPGMGQ